MKISYPINKPYNLDSKSICETLEIDPKQGLSEESSKERMATFGLNIYQVQKTKSIFSILIDQFKNPIIYLLVAACIISFFLGDTLEGIAIIIVIFINASLGFFMELQARNSMNALKSLDKSFSKVLRGGNVQEIAIENITIGDVLLVEAGDVVPADARLINVNQLEVNESALTGESLPVAKNTDLLAENTILADQVNMLFKGTAIVKGNGNAIITGISNETELGKISSMVESAEATVTPLEKKLESLSKKLIWITLGILVIFIINGLIQGETFSSIIKISIALAIAALPEGLPIVATITLARGMLRMAKKNAIVKKLASVETLGGTNIIFTDKTGTLTENKIFVDSVGFYNENLEYKNISNLKEENKNLYKKIIEISCLCNNAEVNNDKELGDPLEIALLRFAIENKVDPNAIKNSYPRIAEEPFSSESKLMSTLHTFEGQFFSASKGSVEDLIKKCNRYHLGEKVENLDDAKRKEWLDKADQLSAKGLRVLAFAYKMVPQKEEKFSEDLTFIGFIGFLDPHRAEVIPAIQACKDAGIRVIMVTGDHPKTAVNIAQKVNLIEFENNHVIIGSELKELHAMTESDKEEVFKSHVFARVTPKQKLDLVTLYQERGNIVAMTGDGINDAPALKKADIGIAMGLRGTQVAKETADIILKDDSFTSIASSIAQGRGIFQNIKNFIIYLLSCNLSEILIVAAMGFVSLSLTLLPLQILFLNLVTDVFPALALGMGKASSLIMKDPPRDPKAPILINKEWGNIFFYSIIMTLAVFGAVAYGYYFLHLDNSTCNNIAFFSLAFSQMWHVFNMSSIKVSFFKNEITQNLYIWGALLICTICMASISFIEPLREVLAVKPLSPTLWLLILITSIIPVVIIQVVRRAIAHFNH